LRGFGSSLNDKYLRASEVT